MGGTLTRLRLSVRGDDGAVRRRPRRMGAMSILRHAVQPCTSVLRSSLLVAHGWMCQTVLARGRAGIRPQHPRGEPARPRVSDEHDLSWGQSFCGDHVSFLVCERHALATGDRAASGPTTRLPGGWTQSAILNRRVLPRTCWVARISLLRRNGILALPAEFHAAVGATAGQVVSSIQ